ncbi:MAG: class I SAM-dependent methyltransferase [Candidatus Cloacimonetes bacterium]|nr:class I SAM-dependent methyltransferase [Candidatus Cloacimonadota bacterium]
MQKISDLLKTRKITRILDVACGKGEFIGMIYHFLGENVKITALDASDKMLELAKKQYTKVEFIKGDAYQMPFIEKSFDLVCLSNSLHHFRHPEKVITEMKRILTENGSIIIQEMISDEDQTPAQKSHIMLHHFSAEIDELNGTCHQQTWNREKLRHFIKNQLGKTSETEYAYPLENPKDEKLLTRFEKTIDFFIQKSAVFKEFEQLHNQGEKIKTHLKTYGFAPAIEMLFLTE